MAVCNPCIKTKTIPNCLSQLVIGTVALVSQSVKVYIQDISTGGLMILTGIVDLNGLVTVDVSEMGFFDNHAYELWITETGAGIGDFEAITIDGITSDIVCLRFQQVTGEDGSVETFLTQTLQEA